jgi:hypothetical protein
MPCQDNVPQQHSDNRFPYVLVISTISAFISLGGVWLASMPMA